ncbi:MAG: SbtA family thio(seleno)oxazole RiPP natural product precursor [Desulfobulbaceae bacterium]|jgi:radical SAM modification target selenobiotic family peptide
MDSKDLKKLLAGLGVAALVSSGSMTMPAAHAAGGSA